jgi:hypothetical protein
LGYLPQTRALGGQSDTVLVLGIRHSWLSVPVGPLERHESLLFRRPRSDHRWWRRAMIEKTKEQIWADWVVSQPRRHVHRTEDGGRPRAHCRGAKETLGADSRRARFIASGLNGMAVAARSLFVRRGHKRPRRPQIKRAAYAAPFVGSILKAHIPEPCTCFQLASIAFTALSGSGT